MANLNYLFAKLPVIYTRNRDGTATNPQPIFFIKDDTRQRFDSFRWLSEDRTPAIKRRIR